MPAGSSRITSATPRICRAIDAGPVFTHVANRNASHVERPYGVLDYIEWSEVQADPVTLGHWRSRVILAATSNFSATQTAAVIRANRTLNGGALRSDNVGDVAYTSLKYRVVGFPRGTLVDGSRDLGPQVDHIIPQSRTGCAVYSNAQVLSGAFNNQKRAAVSAAQARQLGSVKRGTGRKREFNESQKKIADQLAAQLAKLVGRERQDLLADRIYASNRADFELSVISIANSGSSVQTQAIALKRKWRF